MNKDTFSVCPKCLPTISPIIIKNDGSSECSNRCGFIIAAKDGTRETWNERGRSWIKDRPKPDLVLPLPKGTDNKRKLIRGRRMMTAHWVRVYRRRVSDILSIGKLLIPEPPILMLYRVCQKSTMRSDPHNYQKTIVDAIFGQHKDRYVCPMCLPGSFDSDEKKVEIWMVNL